MTQNKVVKRKRSTKLGCWNLERRKVNKHSQQVEQRIVKIRNGKPAHMSKARHQNDYNLDGNHNYKEQTCKKWATQNYLTISISNER